MLQASRKDKGFTQIVKLYCKQKKMEKQTSLYRSAAPLVLQL